jgi:osmoprotectant transport system ATP-binding protein
MIEFRDVRKNFGSVEAVRGVSFAVNQGEVCVLIGPSGCGKTTSLRMINRMIEVTDGTVLVNGRPVKETNIQELRRGIGYVIQSVGLFPHMTVKENIGIVPRLVGWEKPKRGARADELLAMIGLDPESYREKYPHELSGGEAQRVGVARALASDPPILLMDEPFGAVDPLNREVLQREFSALQRRLKKTVVFVTHDLDEAIRLGDRIILMKSGEIVQNDSPERILAQPASAFVREFIGNDRALKRLACFQVGDYLREARVVPEQSALETDFDAHEVVWVCNDSQGLAGILEKNGAPASIVPLESDDVAVTRVSTLRDALSRLLGQGLPAIPVVDDDRRVVGEIRLPDIEEVNQRGWHR